MLAIFRCDASSKIGHGHVRRCASLAESLQSLGFRCHFVCRRDCGDLSGWLQSKGYPVSLLPEDPFSDAADAQATVATIAGMEPDWIIVDHYRLDARWHRVVAQTSGARIAVIDDLANRPLAANVLIDHNFVPDRTGHPGKYQRALESAPDQWLCGPRFALLSGRYARTRPIEVSDRVRSIGIFLGGTDPARLSVTVLSACRQHAGFAGPIEVASTSANPALSELTAAVLAAGNATLTLDADDLVSFHLRHDLQIGAGGGATWERCCLGVPALTLSVAANQQAVIPALAALGAIETTENNAPGTIGRVVAALIASPERRRALAHGGRALVDGRGAQRVALALAASTQGAVTLRPATMADAHILWRWRNDPATRQVSRQRQPIAWDQHASWLEQSLQRSDRRLFIATAGDIEFGVIRFDALAAADVNDLHEVSLYLDPSLYGLGLGAALLHAGERALWQSVPLATIHAEVLPGNPASERMFRAANYRALTDTVFRKPPNKGPVLFAELS